MALSEKCMPFMKRCLIYLYSLGFVAWIAYDLSNPPLFQVPRRAFMSSGVLLTALFVTRYFFDFFDKSPRSKSVTVACFFLVAACGYALGVFYDIILFSIGGSKSMRPFLILIVGLFISLIIKSILDILKKKIDTNYR